MCPVKRMRLVFYLSEIQLIKIYAANIAIPYGPVIEFHTGLIRDRSELSSARKPLRHLTCRMHHTYRNIKTVQDMEGLQHGIKTCGTLRCSR